MPIYSIYDSHSSSAERLKLMYIKNRSVRRPLRENPSTLASTNSCAPDYHARNTQSKEQVDHFPALNRHHGHLFSSLLG